MSIFVCIPTAESIHGLTTAAAFRLCAGHRGGAEFRTVQARPCDYARNLCVQAFLETRHSHLFFLDSDVVPPDDTLDILLATGRPLVCGLYPLLLDGANLCTSVFHRVGPDHYRYIDNHGSAPFEVDAAGMGCCLIAREVFERVAPPWFRFVQRPDCTLTGEDFYFFEQAAKAGYRPLVVPRVQCSHFKMIDLLDVVRVVQRSRRSAGLEVQTVP